MHPVLFSFDFFGLKAEPISLHTYGLLIATGFLFAIVLSKRQAEREDEDPERIVDLGFYVLLAGLIGARIVFILTKLDEYVRDPLAVVMFWRGGLVWYGGFIGAAGFVWYYCKKHRLNYWKFADLTIPYVAMAHAFGRLGCVAAGCCFGQPTDQPWGIVFPVGSPAQQAHQSAGAIGYGDLALPIHPTQLYEAGAEMMMFWILIAVRRHKSFHGQLMLIWLACYPVIRSIIEMFRGDSERGIYIISTSQWISIGVAAFAIWVYFHLRKQRRNAPSLENGSAVSG